MEVQSGNLCRFAENGSSAEDIVLVQGRKGGLFTCTSLWVVTLSEVEANAGQRGILLEPGVEPTVIPHLRGCLEIRLLADSTFLVIFGSLWEHFSFRMLYRPQRWPIFQSDGMVNVFFQATIDFNGFSMVLTTLDHHH